MGTTNRAGKTGAERRDETAEALVLLVLLELLGEQPADDSADVREGDLFPGAPRTARVEVVR